MEQFNTLGAYDNIYGYRVAMKQQPVRVIFLWDTMREITMQRVMTMFVMRSKFRKIHDDWR